MFDMGLMKISTLPSWCFLRDGTVPSVCFFRDGTVLSYIYNHYQIGIQIWPNGVICDISLHFCQDGVIQERHRAELFYLNLRSYEKIPLNSYSPQYFALYMIISV